MSAFASDDRFEAERRRSILGDADLSKDDVFARAARGVRGVFRRLDALPRTDAFRRDTRARSIPCQVDMYCAALVARDPCDAEAWWCHVGVGLWYCANDFGSPGFRGLHTLASSTPRGPWRPPSNPDAVDWATQVSRLLG